MPRKNPDEILLEPVQGCAPAESLCWRLRPGPARLAAWNNRISTDCCCHAVITATLLHDMHACMSYDRDCHAFVVTVLAAAAMRQPYSLHNHAAA